MVELEFGHSLAPKLHGLISPMLPEIQIWGRNNPAIWSFIVFVFSVVVQLFVFFNICSFPYPFYYIPTLGIDLIIWVVVVFPFIRIIFQEQCFHILLWLKSGFLSLKTKWSWIQSLPHVASMDFHISVHLLHFSHYHCSNVSLHHF